MNDIDDDPLGPAKGVALGVAIGAVFWFLAFYVFA